MWPKCTFNLLKKGAIGADVFAVVVVGQNLDLACRALATAADSLRLAIVVLNTSPQIALGPLGGIITLLEGIQQNSIPGLFSLETPIECIRQALTYLGQGDNGTAILRVNAALTQLHQLQLQLGLPAEQQQPH